MCRWCSHRGHRAELEAERADLIATFELLIENGPKAALPTVVAAIREAKWMQKVVRRQGKSSAVIDYRAECLSFAARLIQNGWTNGGKYFI